MLLCLMWEKKMVSWQKGMPFKSLISYITLILTIKHFSASICYIYLQCATSFMSLLCKHPSASWFYKLGADLMVLTEGPHIDSVSADQVIFYHFFLVRNGWNCTARHFTLLTKFTYFLLLLSIQLFPFGFQDQIIK